MSRQRHAWKPRREAASKLPGQLSSKPDRKRWRGCGETGTLVCYPWDCHAVRHHVTQQAIPLLGACPSKPEMRVQTKTFRPNVHGSAVHRSQTAHRLTNNGLSAGLTKRRPLTGAGLLPGVTKVSWDQTVATCGHCLVIALKTPEPHAFKDWLGGVGAGAAACG